MVKKQQRILAHPDFAGLHFTGSTKVFQGMWKMIGDNIHTINLTQESLVKLVVKTL